MAVNPITSEDLTINFSDLLKIPVSDRVQAAMINPEYKNALMQSLTPIQMAKAFPDYYREELPDISNFILANRYLDDKGAGAFTQKGGGDYGEQKSTYSSGQGGTKPQPPPKTVVDKIMEGAKLYEATGKKGVTSAIKDTDEDKIMSTADVSLSPQQRAILDTIAIGNPNKEGYWESPGYNTIVGGKKFEGFADHPRVFGLGNSSAAGRYQFTKTTWDDVVTRYNKTNPDNPITDFGPLNQDRAALFLARERYKANTGRDLEQDLSSPPENFGDLIKAGLGKGGPKSYLTWEIFTQKNAGEIGDAFNENLKRNTDFAKQEAEAAARDNKKLAVEVSKELMDILNSDPMAKKYFLEDKPEMGQRLQEQINAGIIDINGLKGIVDSSASKVRELIQTTEQMAKIGGDAIINEGQTRISEQQQTLAGTRKLPLQDELTDVMDYAAQKISEESGKNIYMKVFSGGQAAIGTAGPRTGSTEHDLGGAADVYYVERLPDGTERTLSMKNPEDKALMYRAAYHFSRAGGRSVGLESGYMGDEAMHLGISRNNEDPVHHGDPELQAVVDQGKNEFLTEARNSGWDLRYGYKDFLERERQARVAAYAEQNKTTATAVPDTPAQRLFIGDSIAQGMKDAAKGEGNTQVGRKPGEVLSEMERMGVDYFKGKEVILSTGLSNNTQDLDSVRKQMEFLKSAGAKVKIAGMSNSREDLAPGNQQLQQLSSEYGYDFMGGYDAGKDKVHPTNYGDYLASATPKEEAAPKEEAVPVPKVPEVPTYQYGGTPKTQDDENLSVFDETGNLRFKMNSGEGIYVKPETEEFADTQIQELSTRIDEMSDRFNSMSDVSAQAQPQQRKKEMPRNNWAQKVISADRPRSPSADRANRRTKFMNEGWRAGGRASPNSTTT